MNGSNNSVSLTSHDTGSRTSSFKIIGLKDSNVTFFEKLMAKDFQTSTTLGRRPVTVAEKGLEVCGMSLLNLEDQRSESCRHLHNGLATV
jgi:hypothetical protein